MAKAKSYQRSSSQFKRMALLKASEDGVTTNNQKNWPKPVSLFY
jgi:hypothetical protein